MKPVRHIHVTCAIIESEGRVLAAQRRPSMSMALKWEFPGGKIDPGESPEQCLGRELIEELGIHVRIKKPLSLSEHRYPEFTITLYPFVCTIESGDIRLTDHTAIVWLSPEKLLSLDWAAADIPVVKSYLAGIRMADG
jgi:8-oxo-dGTP diphosphatase